jgi:hypothetical protein
MDANGMRAVNVGDGCEWWTRMMGINARVQRTYRFLKRFNPCSNTKNMRSRRSFAEVFEDRFWFSNDLFDSFSTKRFQLRMSRTSSWIWVQPQSYSSLTEVWLHCWPCDSRTKTEKDSRFNVRSKENWFNFAGNWSNCGRTAVELRLNSSSTESRHCSTCDRISNFQTSNFEPPNLIKSMDQGLTKDSQAFPGLLEVWWGRTFYTNSCTTP